MDSTYVIGGADRFEAKAEANEAAMVRAAATDAFIATTAGARIHRRPIGGALARGLIRAQLDSVLVGGGSGGGPITAEAGSSSGKVTIASVSLAWRPAVASGPKQRIGPSRELARATPEARPAPGGFADAVSRSVGQPLATPVRAKMEQAFGGVDLSRVRIHTDAPAQAAATRIRARAFARGSDLFFNRGQFETGTPRGLGRLAHELTHALEGLPGGAPSVFQSPLGRGGHAEAYSLRSAERTSASAVRIQRKADAMVRRAPATGGGPAGPALVLAKGAPAPPGHGQVVIGALRVTVVDGPVMALVKGKSAQGGLAPGGFGELLQASTGTPLPGDLAGKAGALLGGDFRGVRIFNDRHAHAAAKAVHAEAFAIGRNVYFGAGMWSPTTATGFGRLVHELTHVKQGQGGAPTLSPKQLQAKAEDGAPLVRGVAGELRRMGEQYTIAGHDALERQALENERVVVRAFSGGMHGVLSRAERPAPTLGAAPSAMLTRPLLRAEPGYPGALALRADPASAGGGPDELPMVSDGVIDDAVQFLKEIGPALGTAADIGIGFIPIAGDVYDVLCGLVGKAIFTWEKLDTLDRILCIAGVIPIPFVTGGLLRRGKKVAGWLLKKSGVNLVEAFHKVVPPALAFLKRMWAKAKELIGRVVNRAAGALRGVGERVKTKFNAVRQGTDPEKVRVLDEGVGELEAMIKKHGSHTSVESFFEYKALRIQGFNASEAMDLIKRFRAGEAVEGFGWHFTNKVGGQGITTSGQMFARKGVAGKGVYMGATPTPSGVQRNLVWGIGPDSNVRIPVKLEGKDAFSAVYPTKTYIVEMAGDAMPLTGKIDHLRGPERSLLQKAWDRYHWAALMAGLATTVTATAAYQVYQSLLFKRTDDPLGGEDAEELAERLEHKRADPKLLRDPGPGLPLELSVRNRLEAFLGADLSGVRVHTGAAASRLAGALGAEAFTHGKHIFLGEGADLSTPEGIGTLVHEATHVVQAERGRLVGPASPMRTRSLEVEAYSTERAFHSGRPGALAPSPTVLAPRPVAAPAREERAAPAPPRLVVREAPREAADVPAPEVAPVVKTPAKVLKKAAAQGKDPIHRIMTQWRVGDMSREEFLEECVERVRELMREEVEADAQRGSTNLAWSYDAPLS